MNIEDLNGTVIMRRRPEYVPPRSWRTWLIGRPLSTADAPHQAIGKLVGLAVFSSDAMSSVAYAPQELMLILSVAGASAMNLAFPLAIAIVVLLFILTVSYEQTIHAYPGGGGAYIVSRDNLGEVPAGIAAAALLSDYILTVSVSISSGVAQIVSAFPGVYDYRVWITVGLIFLVMLINLRGVKELGVAFAIPTYFFLVMMAVTLVIGFVRMFSGNLGTVVAPPSLETTGIYPLTLFLVLRAFANGTTALTEVEAISNGIMAFKEPRSKNAGITLIMMAVVLGTFMLGITYLARHIGVVPAEAETVISQLGRTVFGNRGVFYLMVISSTTVILVMAANTAFADFPRLGALTAADGFLPRQLTYRGSRLVFSRGIMVLAIIASLLVIGFQASVSKLIPLYAIGVFLSFTLSQTGMSRRWWRVGHLKAGEEIVEPGSTLRYEKNWEIKMIVNAVGAVCTAVVCVVFAVTKFTEGAWIVLIILPVLVFIFFSIHRHYKHLARDLSLDQYGQPHRMYRHRVILPISGVHRGTLKALQYAHSLSHDVTVVHVSMDQKEMEKVQKKWEMWGQGTRLVILELPYRLFIEPLLEYIEEIAKVRQPDEMITIVVPQFVPKDPVTNWLHERTANTLRSVLLNQEGIVITEVPYMTH